jgi:two-component system, NtrC family, sensor kinase
MNSAPTTLTTATPGSRIFSSAALFVFLTVAIVVAFGLIDAWLSYRHVSTLFIDIQRQHAESAAQRVDEFVKDIETQLETLKRVPWDATLLEDWQLNSASLLQRIPAITEFARIDETGRERSRISRVALDVIGSYTDFSRDPKFVQALASKRYYGPIYFRQQSEPYMTLAVAGVRREHGVVVAELNLRFIGDAISKVTAGMPGTAFVVDAKGRLIAHTDLSLVLRNIDLSHLSYVRAALTSSAGLNRHGTSATDLNGRPVLTGHVSIPNLSWILFVELPVSEPLTALCNSILRTVLLAFAALGIAILACSVRARPRSEPSGL